MSDAAHQAGVKEVKYSGGEGELSELETDPRPLQSLLGRHALDALPGAGLGGVVLFVGLGEMTVDVTLQHGLQPRTIIIPAWRHCLCWKDKYYPSISCLYARQTLIAGDVSNCRNYQTRNTNIWRAWKYFSSVCTLTWELNRIRHPSTIQSNVNFDPCLGTWRSSQDMELDFFPKTLQPTQRQEYLMVSPDSSPTTCVV